LARPGPIRPSDKRSCYYSEVVLPYLGGTLTFKDAPRPLIPTLEWTVYREDAYENFMDDVIRPHIIGQRRTAFIRGPPGTGKTWKVLKPLAEELRAQGHNVKVISLTHVASRNAGGQTAHSFVHTFVQHGRFKGWLLIDEVSMMCLPLLAALETLSLADVKIVCFGDWEQLPPINNSWRGQVVPPKVFQHSRLMKTWCNCTVFEMTTCHRSDTAHFAWYSSVPQMDLGVALDEARGRFMVDDQPADWNLVISHHRRVKLNTELQAAATRAYVANWGKDKVVDIEVDDEGETKSKRRVTRNRAQSYTLWPGTRLIGSDNEHKNVVNGALLDVVGLDGDEVQIKDLETKEEFPMSVAQVAKHTRLRWAVTYPAIQGRTLEGTVRLWDTTSRHFTLEALYIGVSRATAGSLVSVV